MVNLRGVIVPIVDLRMKLGCASAEYNTFTVVIVLNVKGRVVGAVVDSVSDVLELAEEVGAIKPAPEMSSAVDASWITGIGTVKTGSGDDASSACSSSWTSRPRASADMGLINELH